MFCIRTIESSNVLQEFQVPTNLQPWENSYLLSTTSELSLEIAKITLQALNHKVQFTDLMNSRSSHEVQTLHCEHRFRTIPSLSAHKKVWGGLSTKSILLYVSELNVPTQISASIPTTQDSIGIRAIDACYWECIDLQDHFQNFETRKQKQSYWAQDINVRYCGHHGSRAYQRLIVYSSPIS